MREYRSRHERDGFHGEGRCQLMPTLMPIQGEDMRQWEADKLANPLEFDHQRC